MKKLFVTFLIAIVATTSALANDKASKTNNWNINNKKMAESLDLSFMQRLEFNIISNRFEKEMNTILSSEDSTKNKKIRDAVYKNLRSSRKTLNTKQYRKYLIVLNTTLRNKQAEQFLYVNAE